MIRCLTRCRILNVTLDAIVANALYIDGATGHLEELFAVDAVANS